MAQDHFPQRSKIIYINWFSFGHRSHKLVISKWNQERHLSTLYTLMELQMSLFCLAKMWCMYVATKYAATIFSMATGTCVSRRAATTLFDHSASWSFLEINQIHRCSWFISRYFTTDGNVLACCWPLLVWTQLPKTSLKWDKNRPIN